MGKKGKNKKRGCGEILLRIVCQNHIPFSLIIIGDDYQIILHCLIPKDPWGVSNYLPEEYLNNSGTDGKISPSCIQDSPPQLWTYIHLLVLL